MIEDIKKLLNGGLLLILAGIPLSVSASLEMEDIQAIYGEHFEIINEVPGRPWVEVQHRYDEDGVVISCNYVNNRCLWIDYFSRDKRLSDEFVFEELNRLFPNVTWKPADQRSRSKRWLNEKEDRVTIRSKGFTLHTNDYIRNVLSRRAQWSF